MKRMIEYLFYASWIRILYWNGDKYYEGKYLNKRQHGKGNIHYDGKVFERIFIFGRIIKGN